MSVNSTNANSVIEGYENISSPLDYFRLMKPRVMSLVVFTAFVGYYVSTPVNGYYLNPFLAFIGILAIALGAGASGVLNQWYDRDIDKLMERTKDRPIPQGKIIPSEALSFGIIVSVLSIIILGLSVNWMAAGLLAFTIFFLCCNLHNLVKTNYRPKYCDRWCRWRVSSCNRSNMCDWIYWYGVAYIIIFNQFFYGRHLISGR